MKYNYNYFILYNIYNIIIYRIYNSTFKNCHSNYGYLFQISNQYDDQQIYIKDSIFSSN